jgi:hypothetical protein
MAPSQTKFDFLKTKRKKLDPAAEAELLAGAKAKIDRLLKQESAAIVGIGLELLKVKIALGHNLFGRWIDNNFGFSRRAAQYYMTVARVLGEKCASVAHLRRTTIYDLASRRCPDAARSEVFERIKAGETLDDDQVYEIMIRALKAERMQNKEFRRKQAEAPLVFGDTTAQRASNIQIFLDQALNYSQLCSFLAMIDNDPEAFEHAINDLLNRIAVSQIRLHIEVQSTGRKINPIPGLPPMAKWKMNGGSRCRSDNSDSSLQAVE